jgi:MscS family membrane protein
LFSESSHWIIKIFLLFAIALGLRLGFKAFFQWRKRQKNNSLLAHSCFEALPMPLDFLLLGIAITASFGIIDQEWNHPSWLATSFSLIPFVFLISSYLFFFRWKKMMISGAIDKSKRGEIQMTLSSLHALNKLGTVVSVFLLFLITFDLLGFGITPLLAIGSIGGALIGFATKDLIANFFGGIFLYLTQPFAPGDEILLTLKDIQGEVDEIGWYMTRIIDLEKRPVYVPNALFFQAIVISLSKRSHRLIKESIPLKCTPPLTSLPLALEEINQLLSSSQDIDSSLRHEATMSGIASYSCQLELICYTRNATRKQHAAIKQNLLLQTLALLTKHGLQISENNFSFEIVLPKEFKNLSNAQIQTP